MDDDVQKFIVAGADAVLAKPVTLEVIQQVVKYVDHHGNTTLASQGLHLTFDCNRWILRKILK